MAFDLSRSHRAVLDAADFKAIEDLFRELETEGAAILGRAADDEKILFERTLMMRFVGQGAETDLAIAPRPFDQWRKADIRELFDTEYRRLYGRTYDDNAVEFVTFKVRASLPAKPFNIPPLKNNQANLAECVKSTRPAYSLARKDFVKHTVYDRSALFPGAAFEGPAIIEERESTIVVGEGAAARVDEFGFVWVDLH